ncbi:NAD(P)-dependent dehydrogenase, short-chain alcohol dehydrogenase family [Variovorax sp. HW608]|uniref:SDR family NAD(P)-dependent oxidoreductase n=1 Tax=Variovorax sp. HW608 TaxID=1034889 RepID=UPI0008201038|nr:SDR family NAD(P)-dependent oxidoreductase [Variovorax sp. HW608]SCK43564.1 NAD(P)-dependent dehydrogenase, short-chain alcohol dehydrogenase family [Variovorax sp. HW608]
MSQDSKERRLALVTGGGRGIGEAVCRQLASQGLRVVVADIDGDNAARVARELGAGHAAETVDVADEAAVIGLFERVEAAHGPVAVLVCVAGLLILPNGERPLIKDMSMDTWERSFAVNTRGAFLCSREYLRRREANPLAQGRVVFFGSVAAQLGGYRSSAAYIGAKAAVHGYAKAFARESAHLRITANVIAPGLIDTDMLRATVTSSGALAAAAQNIPLGRVGRVDDVAAAVAYLVSPAAEYITGNVIDVNGGYRMQ